MKTQPQVLNWDIFEHLSTYVLQTKFKYDNHRIPPDCEYIASLIILNYQKFVPNYHFSIKRINKIP